MEAITQALEWDLETSRTRGKQYWLNRRTKESVWDKPNCPRAASIRALVVSHIAQTRPCTLCGATGCAKLKDGCISCNPMNRTMPSYYDIHTGEF